MIPGGRLPAAGGPASHKAAGRKRFPTPTLPSVFAVAAGYATIAFGLLSSDILYSGDMGVKYVQARSLLLHGFRSMALPYPGRFIDPSGEFFAFVRPFVFRTESGIQSIFPPATALLYAPFTAFGGFTGMALLSVLAGVAIVWLTGRLAARSGAALVTILLGFGTCLWFYAVLAWEHAPAAAFDIAAVWIASSRPALRSAVAAGMLLGMGGALRDESLLLLPGLLLVIWRSTHAIDRVVAACAAVAGVLVGAGIVEVLLFERPMAAHLRHAVHLLRSAFHLAGTPNPELPVLRPLTLGDRWDIVAHQWLAGFSDAYILGFVVLTGLAFVLMRRFGSPIGVMVICVIALYGAILDLESLLPAPRFVGGLYRLSPFLVLALMPEPPGESVDGQVSRSTMLVASGLYVTLALVGLDTTGGKSLGPRLLLPIIPLLALQSCQTLVAYVRARDRSPVHWIVAATATLLAAASVVLQVGCMLPALVGRNHADRAAIDYLRQAPEQIVVADDPFTAQLISTLYFKKIILLADAGDQAALVGRLARARLPAVVISRLETPALDLHPYQMVRSETLGRMTIQHWHR